MPSTLLPPLLLSSALESVKIDITCAGRPAQRPTLPSQDSFSSSASGSTDATSSSRRTRPILSPEALLVHAFGPTALSKLAPATNDDQPSSRSASNSTCSPSRGSVTSRRRRKREKFRETHNSLAAAPPPGTFRSVAKPAKALLTRPPLSEPNSFQANHGDSLGEQRGVVEARECERTSEREPPMSLLQWREKMEDRPQRRKLLRRKNDAQGATKMPLDIDCRPMEGSMNLPPTSVVPKTYKQRIHERSCLLRTASLAMLKDAKETKTVSPEEKEVANDPSSSPETTT